MKNYKQLTSEQRYQILGLKRAGMNLSQIADEAGVHKSTIYREFNRNRGLRGWRPKHGEGLRDIRRQKCLYAKRLALEAGVRISHEMIYLHIYADKRKNGNLS
jgi:transposase, IS30 family